MGARGQPWAQSIQRRAVAVMLKQNCPVLFLALTSAWCRTAVRTMWGQRGWHWVTQDGVWSRWTVLGGMVLCVGVQGHPARGLCLVTVGRPRVGETQRQGDCVFVGGSQLHLLGLPRVPAQNPCPLSWPSYASCPTGSLATLPACSQSSHLRCPASPTHHTALLPADSKKTEWSIEQNRKLRNEPGLHMHLVYSKERLPVSKAKRDAHWKMVVMQWFWRK